MQQYKIPDDLYGYQKEDYQRMLGEGGFLNVSEMGTGKTPESLAVIEEGHFQSPLIICPNSLRLEWARQIETWLGVKCAVCTTDSYTKLGPILQAFQKGIKYKIINYETLRSLPNMEILKHLWFDIIIFDEIHKLRNPKTKLVIGEREEVEGRKTGPVRGGVWKFLEEHQNAKILALSGSPVMNYPNDLYVPLSVARPDIWHRDSSSWRNFMYKYCLWSNGQFGPYVYGTRNMSELRAQMEPFTIRRLKKDVLKFLPDKYYQRIQLEMPPDQRKAYNDMRDQLCVLLDTGEPLWSTSVLSTLTRLRQINLDPKIVGLSVNSAKTEYLTDLVESMVNTNKNNENGIDNTPKLVVFSTFEKYIHLLSTIYFKDIPHVVITGQVSTDDRAKRVKQFQEDEHTKLCLGTIQTMGEGLTLTAASTCCLADRWWNEPTNTQAEDRLHRIGQRNSVQILYPVVKDSADEILDEVLQRKADANQEYLSETQVRSSIISSIRGT